MRNLPAALKAAFSADVVKRVYLVDLDYSSAPVRVHSWAGPLDMADPVTGEILRFDGIGDLGGIEGLEQPDGLRGSDAALTMTGLDPKKMAKALNEHYQGRQARIFLSALDANGRLAGDAGVTVFRGFMDVKKVTLGDTASIRLTARNEFVDWERPVGLRYSDAEQKRLFPGDTGLSRIAFAAERTIVWQI